MPPEVEGMDARSRGRRREARAEEAAVEASRRAEGRMTGASGGPAGLDLHRARELSRRRLCVEPWMATENLRSHGWRSSVSEKGSLTN